MTRSQFSDPPSPLPFLRLLFCTSIEEKIWSVPRHFLLWCWGRCSCRNCFSWVGNWIGSRKMTAQCEERHIQLLCELRLYNLMLFPCWSEPFRCWWTEHFTQTEFTACFTWQCVNGWVVLASGEAWIRTQSAAQHLSLGQGSLGLAAAWCWLQPPPSPSLTSPVLLDQRMRSEVAWGTEAVHRDCCCLLSQTGVWLCLVDGVALCESLDTF